MQGDAARKRADWLQKSVFQSRVVAAGTPETDDAWTPNTEIFPSPYTTPPRIPGFGGCIPVAGAWHCHWAACTATCTHFVAS
eukprot:m.16105 g.16105  ORF g.16105 m.16105 type:complete len:82 (+) comp8911_c0_seq1:111-356(+)